MASSCIALTLATLVSVAFGLSPRCPPDAVRTKSIAQAQEQCVGYLRIPRARLAVYNEYIYPNDTETQCMVRCVGLNLGWWDDANGVQKPALRNYFHPDPDDCQYERRTYHCLKSQRLDCGTQHADPCARAYDSFRCYYEQYGNLVLAPQFVPLSAMELAEVLHQCANILQVPTDCASQHAIDCLGRCLLLRTGVYTDKHGPNLDRLYVQCNNYANETLFRQTTSACYRQLKAECPDECTLAGRFLRECFDESGGILGNIGQFVMVLARTSGMRQEFQQESLMRGADSSLKLLK
uniref:Odorant-binding protein n=1 Tax=Anopheles farauti TaxID=69004 RepID=A0A182QJ61_9DIPT